MQHSVRARRLILKIGIGGSARRAKFDPPQRFTQRAPGAQYVLIADQQRLAIRPDPLSGSGLSLRRRKAGIGSPTPGTIAWSTGGAQRERGSPPYACC
jgi:hypothetical protein